MMMTGNYSIANRKRAGMAPIRDVACFLFLMCLLLPTLAVASESAAHQYRVIGYVMDGKTLPKISAEKLDVINFAFALVKPDNTLHLPGDTAAQSLSALVALRQINPQLKVLVSVGGWGGDHFSEAALSEDSRARFVESAAELITQYDLDGVDVDWEYPTLPGPGITYRPEDRENFSLLLEALRARLDVLGKKENGRHYLLTIAAADGEAAQGLEIVRITASLDWINLMTYDFYGSLTSTTGHHASLHRSRTAAADGRATDLAIAEFLAAGVPPRKLNVGVAFYGRGFADVMPQNNGLNQPFKRDGGFLSWRQINAEYVDQQGFVRHWDEQAQAPYLWNAQSNTFISYDDPQSLQAKTAFVKQQGLGGIMYWEHRQDADEQLLDVVRKGLSAD